MHHPHLKRTMERVGQRRYSLDAHVRIDEPQIYVTNAIGRDRISDMTTIFPVRVTELLNMSLTTQSLIISLI